MKLQALLLKVHLYHYFLMHEHDKLFDVALRRSKCSWIHANKIDISSKQKIFQIFLSVTDKHFLKSKKMAEFILKKKPR